MVIFSCPVKFIFIYSFSLISSLSLFMYSSVSPASYLLSVYLLSSCHPYSSSFSPSLPTLAFSYKIIWPNICHLALEAVPPFTVGPFSVLTYCVQPCVCYLSISVSQSVSCFPKNESFLIKMDSFCLHSYLQVSFSFFYFQSAILNAERAMLLQRMQKSNFLAIELLPLLRLCIWVGNIWIPTLRCCKMYCPWGTVSLHYSLSI